MPTMGQTGNRGRVKQVGGKITQASFAKLRARQDAHRLSMPDILELFALRMTDAEVRDTVGRWEPPPPAENRRDKQVSGKISEEAYDRLRDRQKDHDNISTPDVIEMITWHVTDDEIEVLVQRDRDSRLAAA